MKAVICRFSLPFTTSDGVRAITAISSALVPLVHHSFSPFRIHASPSSLDTALVSRAVASEDGRSEEDTSELQSPYEHVCRRLLDNNAVSESQVARLAKITA